MKSANGVLCMVDVLCSGVIALAVAGWKVKEESRSGLIVISLSVGRCLLSLFASQVSNAAARIFSFVSVLVGHAVVLSVIGAPHKGPIEIVGLAWTCVAALVVAAIVASPTFFRGEAEGNSDLEAPLIATDDDDEGSKKKSLGWWRLILLSRPEWGMMGMATVALVLGLLSQLALPSLFGQMIDAITDDSHSHEHQRRQLLSAFTELLVLLSASLVFTGARSYIFNVSGEKVVARVRRKLFAAMLSQEVGWFDQSRTGDLMNRLSSDTTKLQSAATESISMLLRSTASAVLSLALLFLTSWFLTLVTIAVVPLMIIVAGISSSMIKKLSEKYQAALAAAANVAQEVLSNVRIVRSFGADAFETERYAKAVGNPAASSWTSTKDDESSYAIGVRRAGVVAVFVSLMLAFGFASCVIVIYVGGLLVIRGDLSVGSLISFVMYLLNIAESMGILAGLLASVQDAIGASVVVFDIIDRKPKQKQPVERQIVSSRDDGEASAVAGGKSLDGSVGASSAMSCEFVDVHFSYPSRSDVKVLNGVTLKIDAGMRAAVCGPSGGGKSTTFSLIERFYDADAGSLLLDGIDVTQIPLAVLRERIALVAQEPALFSGTIADNISYAAVSRGRPVDKNEVETIARAAHVDTFVSTFPDKYDTLVGERGMKLSGGQKQRVAIARALYANPSLLLLDEATSALDAESEALVQAAIDRLVVGRTSLTIAHRLSTVVDADLIAVIVDGRCVGHGIHSDLLKTCPQYQSLVRKQLAANSQSDLQQQVSASLQD